MWHEWEETLAVASVRGDLALNGAKDPQFASDQRRSPSIPKFTTVGVIVASILSVGAIAYTVVSADQDVSASPRPSAVAMATPAPVKTPAAAAPAATPPASRIAQRPPSPKISFPIDERGFVDSSARCTGDLTLAAAGRTNRALVAVCRSRDGRLEYNGVRISDLAELHLTDVNKTPAGFAAHNDDTTYLMTAKELLVTGGATTLSRDAMIEYRTASPRT